MRKLTIEEKTELKANASFRNFLEGHFDTHLEKHCKLNEELAELHKIQDNVSTSGDLISNLITEKTIKLSQEKIIIGVFELLYSEAIKCFSEDVELSIFRTDAEKSRSVRVKCVKKNKKKRRGR